jgi:hypothetical protein
MGAEVQRRSPDTSIMATDTAAWFGASLQERRRLQSVLWYDGWSCLLTSTLFDQWFPALAPVVGSGITVDSGIMYVPNGWWKHRWATC